MLANLLQFIRVKTRSRAVLVGAVAAAALVVAGGWATGYNHVLGFGINSSVTSFAHLSSQDSQGSDSAGDPSRGGGTNGHAGTGSGSTHANSGKTTCPTGGIPAAGSTVNGGLVVNGPCTVTNVTINGGVLIEGSGHLTLYRSTVNGGTDVQPGGEFDSNFPKVAGGANVLNGGISADHAVNMDIHGGTIHGKVLFIGQVAPSPDRFTVCGVDLQGDLTVEGVPATAGGTVIGDSPEAGDFASICTNGNTISGSVVIRDNPGSRIELEGNRIGGSVQISNSRPSVTSNTIGGSLDCHQGGSLGHWDTDDANTNIVHGANRCA